MDRRHGSSDDWRAMPKKAGPKRIDPETFAPKVLTAQGTNLSILVCMKRWFRGPNVIGAPSDVISSNCFRFPVVIILSPNVEVQTDYVNTGFTWIAAPPENHSISEKCAKIALAEVWHTVIATLDIGTMSLHVTSRVGDWEKYKNGTRMRNLVCALCWELWNEEGLDLKTRTQRLNVSGNACSLRQLTRFMNDHGLSLKKAG